MTSPVRLNGNGSLGLGVLPTFNGRTPITGAPRRKLATQALGGAPFTDSEVGSVFDFFSGAVSFPTDWDTRVWDNGRPTPGDIDEMLRRDGKASSIDLALSLPITKAPYSIEAPQDSAHGALVSDDVLQFCMDSMLRPTTAGGMETPIETIIAQLTTSFGYRRVYFEKIYTRQNNRMVYRDLAWRPPASCTVRREPKSGRLLGFSQQVPGEMIPAEVGGIYSWVHINGPRRNPVRGTCDMEPAFWGYITKQKVALLWFTYLESQSLPRIIAPASSESAALELAKALAALKNNGVVGIPDSWLGKSPITPLNVSGQGGGQFLDALNWIDSQSSLSVLIGFTDLPGAASAGRGSNALSQDQSAFFMDLETARAKELSASITSGALADLVHLNFGPDVGVPNFKIGPLSTDDITQQITMLTTLATATEPNVPTDFIQELIMAVAKAWNMDLDKIQSSLTNLQSQIEQKAQNAQEAKLAPVTAAAEIGRRVATNANANPAANAATASANLNAARGAAGQPV